MIDSSKKQQQGFPEILPVGEIEPLKEKECLDPNSQKSLKEAPAVPEWTVAPGDRSLANSVLSSASPSAVFWGTQPTLTSNPLLRPAKINGSPSYGAPYKVITSLLKPA